MGWTHSPPYFCAYTEVITDLANTTTSITAEHPKLSHIDVYMDDFMVIAQAPAHIPAMNHLLHSIDSVLIKPQMTIRCPVVSM
jgi:hypothetical protein